MTYLTHTRQFASGTVYLSPKGATPRSPGLPLWLPWERRQCATSQPHRGCDRVKACCTDATALRLRNSFASVPRVAEAATLGFEPQPLRGKAKLGESSMSLPMHRGSVKQRQRWQNQTNPYQNSQWFYERSASHHRRSQSE